MQLAEEEMMALGDVWRLLEAEVFAQPSTAVLFNQYRDSVPGLDNPDAVAIRRENLNKYVGSFAQPPRILLVGEAPGPKGCRFTGVPFTSEYQLVSAALPFSGQQSSNRHRPFKESTATLFWRAIAGFEDQLFVWNSVPFHPHDGVEPLSIRAPTTAEIRQHAHILRGIIDLLEPRQVMSVGKHAAKALAYLGVSATHVRHPSRGGAAEFSSGIARQLSSPARKHSARLIS